MQNSFLKNMVIGKLQNLTFPLGLLILSLSFNAHSAFTTPVQTLINGQGETLSYHQLKADSPAAKPPIILLGGGPGFSSWNLEPIQKLLQTLGHDTYLMDMRGIGENSNLPNRTENSSVTELWVEDIYNLVEHINTSNSANSKPVLVGHSWGALMAMLYTRKYPDKVTQLLLLNPVDPEKNAMRDLTENIHQKNQQLNNTDWDDESAWDNEVSNLSSEEQARKITELQITQVLPTYFYDYQQGQDYAKLFDHRDFNIDLNVNAWKAYDVNPVTYDQIRGWNLPIDFLDCRQDTLMPENLHALETNQVLRKVMVLDKCSHFPWIEQPEAFKDSMKYLLKD